METDNLPNKENKTDLEWLNEWIDRTILDGVFETKQDAYEIMAYVGLMFCEAYGIDRNVIKKEFLPLSLDKMSSLAIANKDLFVGSEFNKIVDRMSSGDFCPSIGKMAPEEFTGKKD